MKRKQNKIIIGIIGIILLILFFIFGFNTLQTIFNPRDLGWQSYSLNTVGLSELNNSLTCYSNRCGEGNSACYLISSSTFWEASYGSTSGECGWPVSVFTGDDNNVMITSGYKDGTSSSFKFKENIKGQHLKFEYESRCAYNIYPSACSILGINLNGVGTMEIEPSIVNRDNINIYKDGAFLETRTISSSDFYLTGTCSICPAYRYGVTSSDINIKNIKYKPLFDCIVDNDEVLVSDEFTSGSTINLNSLSYSVKKFCINNPPIIRSFSSLGTASDSNGEILNILIQGGQYVVKSTETVRIYYITQTQTGINRCNQNEAWNTNLKRCENILQAGQITENYTSSIINVNIGENQIAYIQKYDSPAINIGSNTLSFSKPSFNCDCNSEGYITYPAQKECWVGKLNSQTNLIPGESIKFNNYVTIKYDIQAAIYNRPSLNVNCDYRDNSDWTNIITLTINKAGLKITKVDDINNLVLNESKNLNVYLTNNIVETTSGSGFRVKLTNIIIGSTNEYNYEVPLKINESKYSIPINTNVAGDTIIELVPYITVGDKVVYGTTKSLTTYKVIIPNSNIDIMSFASTNENNNIYLILIIFISLLIVVFIISKLYKKKRK